MKTTLSFFALICFFALSSASAQDMRVVAVSAEPVASLKWNETTHNFGTVPQGKPVKTVFYVTNTSGQTLYLKEVKASCGCTATGYTQDPVAPGERAEITATYSAATEGVFAKTITVKTNLSDQPVVLRIQGTVE
jgi:hypothetical protein